MDNERMKVATFIDTNGKEWLVEFDAFLLDEIRSEIGIDLADLASRGYAKVDSDAISLIRVLSILCRDEYSTPPGKLTPRQFGKLIRGEAFASGRAAIARAARDFFPPSEWSEIQSSLAKRKESQKILASGKEFSEVWDTVGPILTAIETMPPDMKEAAMVEVKKQIEEAGGDSMDLEKLTELASAIDQDSTPSNAVTDSPESAESPPED